MSEVDNSEKIAVELTNSIASLWKDGVLKDLTVILDDHRIECHSFMLCACSQYFRDRIRPSRQNSLAQSITVTGIDVETFKLILELIHTSETDKLLTPDNVKEVWKAAEVLQMPQVVKVCKVYYVRNPSLENYEDVYKYVRLNYPKCPMGPILFFILKHFKTCRKSRAFLDLTINEMNVVTQNLLLGTDSEDLVIDSVCKWTAHVPDEVSFSQRLGAAQNRALPEVRNRRAYLAALLQTTNIYTASKKFLKKLIAVPMIANDSRAKDIVQDAISYKENIDRRHGQWLRRGVYRRWTPYINVWVFVYKGTQVVGLGSEFGEKCFLPKLPASVIRNLQLLVFDNKLVVMGRIGSSSNWIIFTYNSEISNWNRRFIVRGEHYKACACGEYLYFFETTSQKVTRFKMTLPPEPRKFWQANFKQGEQIIAVTSHEGQIVVFSKTKEKELTETSVHYLDFASQTWCRLDSLPGVATNLICFNSQGNAFVLQNTGKMWHLFTSDDGKPSFKFLTRLWEPLWDVYGVRNFPLKNSISVCGSDDPAMYSYTDSYPIPIPGVTQTIHLVPWKTKAECCVETFILRPGCREKRENIDNLRSRPS